MRIRIESGGFTSAVDACRTANQISALLAESLAGKLGGFGGMAGDDSTSVEFAAAYDDGARDALETLAELAHSFIGLGRLIGATGANHSNAEAASAAISAFTGEFWHDDDFVRVSPSPPPSSLGANAPSLGVVETFILDHIEGFVWPGADVELLSEAAATWRRTAESVDALDARVDTIAILIERQVSPEIPLATASLAELRSLTHDTAHELRELATSCEEYAAAVRATHERTLDLLSEIGQMVVEGATISLIVGGLTGGLGAGATGTAMLTRIGAQAPRFHALLTTLRISGTASAGRVRTAREGLGVARTRLEKFAQARVRNESGKIHLPLRWSCAYRRRLKAIAETIRDPKTFKPDDLKGLSPKDLTRLLDDWPHGPSRAGEGLRFADPVHAGRQIRVMDGYPGNRPDSLTHGPYALVSQNGTKIEIPLEGNPHA